MIEKFIHKKKVYAEIIRSNVRSSSTKFFSNPKSSFQFGFVAHKKGYFEEPHYHKRIKRTIAGANMESETVQIITIPVRSDIDPATLLDIAHTLADDLADTIESYGEEASVLEEEISVEDDSDNLYGGEGK